jgi:NAD(P)-dependent dehydrogenase (short-subunit alcohol dehydrogenase family)
VRNADDCVRWAEETARQFGGLDILVNCAAGNFLAAAEALSPNGFRTGGAALCPQLLSVVPGAADRACVHVS